MEKKTTIFGDERTYLPLRETHGSFIPGWTPITNLTTESVKNLDGGVRVNIIYTDLSKNFDNLIR